VIVHVILVGVGVVPGTERGGQAVLGDLPAPNSDRGFRRVCIPPEGVLTCGHSRVDGAVDGAAGGAPRVNLVVATWRARVGTGADVDLGGVVLGPGVQNQRTDVPADVEDHGRLCGMS
jgi:hypothetical protein